MYYIIDKYYVIMGQIELFYFNLGLFWVKFILDRIYQGLFCCGFGFVKVRLLVGRVYLGWFVVGLDW